MERENDKEGKEGEKEGEHKGEIKVEDLKKIRTSKSGKQNLKSNVENGLCKYRVKIKRQKLKDKRKVTEQNRDEREKKV